ncbi:low affinity iron permease family protein [Legionella lytica]|uniref:Low affinity iron permease family protein n=1 Tax=Legionella lytica TaxID=96232 RepID=A0ABW8DD90_9GAMM
MDEQKNNKPLFSQFAQWISELSGKAGSFLLASLLIVIWLVTGPFFNYSDTWQLLINTGTTIVTFLMVFLIQNTQNRDTKIINLKLDELIKSHLRADNLSIDLASLSDKELEKLEKHYNKVCHERSQRMNKNE